MRENPTTSSSFCFSARCLRKTKKKIWIERTGGRGGAAKRRWNIRFSSVISVPLYFHFLVINIYDRGTESSSNDGRRRGRKFVFRNLEIVHVDPRFSEKGANFQVKEWL